MNNKITSNIFTALLVIALMIINVESLKAQNEKSSMDPPTEHGVDQESDRRVEIPSETLPEAISENILTNYKDAQIIKSWKWVNDEAEIVKYEVHIDKQGEDVRLEYSTEGKPMTLEKK
ncbi:MAG: hypothetical protein ACPF9D_05820 [Owenweeksia sp.]